MTLQPCSVCHRHVDVHAPACVFCGAAQRPQPSRLRVHAARLSRAAVFAGASACYTSAPPPTTTPPPPDREVAPPPGTGDFAKPPDDDVAPASTGRVEVQVLTGQGTPIPGWVEITGPRGAMVGRRQADSTGRLQIDLPPGNYTFMLPNDHPRRAPIERSVTVTMGAVVRIVLQHVIEPPGNPAMPYGAPPLRGRVV